MAHIRVREVREADAAAITAVHCSDETVWHAYERDGAVTTYERLTPGERWLHGGSWMDEELYRCYLTALRAAGHTAYGAEVDGVLRGHVELFDDPNGLHVGLLWVHAHHRGRGLGRLLIAAAAAAGGRRPLTVRPNAAATGFYQTVGFRPWRELPGWTVQVPEGAATSAPVPTVPPEATVPGRLHVGATTVTSHTRFLWTPPPFALPLFARIVHVEWPGRRLVLVPDWSGAGRPADAHVFASGPLTGADVDMVLQAARQAGFAAVRCYTDPSDCAPPSGAARLEPLSFWRRPPG